MATLPDNILPTVDGLGTESASRTTAIIDKLNELGVGDNVSIPQVHKLPAFSRSADC
jgi:hypothetical protein